MQRVALVTGGTGGLGEAICRRLARDGYRVVAAGSLANDDVSVWQAQQKREGFDFDVVRLDVADEASCQRGVMEAVTLAGRIDILINNAGIMRNATLHNMQPDDWLSVRRAGLDSVFHMSRAVLHGMLEERWGRIINIASVSAEKGAAGQTNYCAAKAAMHGFTKALALEMAAKGITVNTVSPGYLRTKMVLSMSPGMPEKHILPEIPAGRLGEPDEVAGLIAYLCSEEAGFITGANIAINGGQHMY